MIENLETVNMRPHHFFHFAVQAALRGRESPLALGLQSTLGMLLHWAILRDMPGYFEDTLGTTPVQVWRHQAGVRRYLQELRSLAPTNLIKFSLEPDGICKSCPIGRHCLTTNFRKGREFDDIHHKLDVEQSSLTRIVSNLQNEGFQDGSDFWHEPTPTTLYDLSGKPLTYPINPIPQQIDFNALVARVGALRTII